MLSRRYSDCHSPNRMGLERSKENAGVRRVDVVAQMVMELGEGHFENAVPKHASWRICRSSMGIDSKFPQLRAGERSPGLHLPRRLSLFGLWLRGTLHSSPAI